MNKEKKVQSRFERLRKWRLHQEQLLLAELKRIGAGKIDVGTVK